MQRAASSSGGVAPPLPLPLPLPLPPLPQRHCWRRQTLQRRAPAARGPYLITAAASTSSAAATTVVERRAADLIVVGGAPEAALAAYSAARAGRKVRRALLFFGGGVCTALHATRGALASRLTTCSGIPFSSSEWPCQTTILSSPSHRTQVILLPSFGLQAPPPPPRAALQPLKLTAASPLAAHLAAEAAAYWRGLAALADARLVAAAPTLDVVFDASADHAGARAFARLAPAAAAAGARVAAFGGAGAGAALAERLGHAAPLALPARASAAALLQPDGGVLFADAADGAARALAERAGVLVRERLRLRGWADAGGAFFRVEAASPLLPDAVSVFEAEALLVAPGGGWAPEALRLFGLRSELEAREAVAGGWLAGAEATKLPVWQFWGAAAAADDPAPLLPCYGLPAVTGGGRVGLAQAPWQGRLVSSSAALFDATGGATAFAYRPGDAARAARALEVAGGALLRDASLEARRDESEEEETRGDGRGRSGIGGSSGGRDARQRRRLRHQLLTVSADGLPAAGWHPGLEPGRLLVACGAAAGQAFAGSSLPSYQLAPIVAKVAADLLLGRAALPPGLLAPAAGGESEEAAAARRAAAWREQWRGDGQQRQQGQQQRRDGQQQQKPAAGGDAAGPSAVSDGGGDGADDDGGISSVAAALWAGRPAVGLRAAGPAAPAAAGGGAAAAAAAGPAATAPAASAPAGTLDTLKELWRLQRAPPASALDRERAADEASDRRRAESGGDGFVGRGGGIKL